MKKVLFHYPILNMGGAEKSSLRMIKALCDRGWDVTLVLTTGGGALEPEIDPRVRVVRLRPRACGHRFVQARGLWPRLTALPDLACYALMRLIGAVQMLPFLFRRYDAGVTAFHGTSSWFIRSIIHSDCRIHWIRTDLHCSDPTSESTDAMAKVDAKLNWYVCVAETVKKSLVERIPQAAEKSIVIYNILGVDSMRKKMLTQQRVFPHAKESCIRILTVCRLVDRDKALFRMVTVCRALKSEGFNFRWYVIGDGPDQAALEAAILDTDLTDTLVLLGNKDNPFPFYRDADLVAMVSYHEGLSGIINEAKVCGRSVFAVRVSGVSEQLTDGVNGWIVENDESAIIDGLRRLLSNPEMIKHTTNYVYPKAILSDEEKVERLERVLLNQRPELD